MSATDSTFTDRLARLGNVAAVRIGRSQTAVDLNPWQLARHGMADRRFKRELPQSPLPVPVSSLPVIMGQALTTCKLMFLRTVVTPSRFVPRIFVCDQFSICLI